MIVIPSINVFSFEEAASHISKLEAFLPAGAWVQIDVADGTFTDFRNWSAPEALQQLRASFAIELHLMIADVEASLKNYIAALLLMTRFDKRIIVHAETIQDFSYVLETCRAANVEVGLAFNPETSLEFAAIYFRSIRFVQLLGVTPGSSGQTLQPIVLERVKQLKKQNPSILVELDGGINPETARLAKEAGADFIVSGSYIFDHPLPKAAYATLAQI